MIRLVRRAGRVVPGGVATFGAAAVIAGGRRAGDHGIELAGPRLCSAVDAGELVRDWLAAAAAGFVEIGGSRPGGRRATQGWAGPGGPACGRC